MKIGIAFIGSRGIPARYGGNETFIEELSKKLTHVFDIFVTCESYRFFADSYQRIKRIHIASVHKKSVTIPAVNDIIATMYLILRYRNKIDIFYYVTSDGALSMILPKLLKKIIIVNTDGIEWMRPLIRMKYLNILWKIICLIASIYLKFAEWLSVKLSDTVIADSKAIKAYLKKAYGTKKAIFIPYGARKLLDASITCVEERDILNEYKLSPGGYYLTVGRIVAENGIHLEIAGFKKSKSSKKLVIVGNFDERDGYTKYLFRIKGDDPRIIFLSPIYDKKVLGVLRKNCYAYIHAYEVGGTNPSLLEQMLFNSPIIARDVPFHKEILGDCGIYFKDENQLAQSIELLEKNRFETVKMVKQQTKRIKEEYNWDIIGRKYEILFKRLYFARQRLSK